MLKKVCFSFSILLFVTVAAFGQKAKPQTADKKPRSVTDFLQILPKNYIGNYTVAARQKYLKDSGTIDTANGYLNFAGTKENEPFVVVAIFKKDDGNYLITTAVSGSDKQKYYFLDYDGKKFTDAAKRVLPAEFGVNKFQEGYTCELPRFNRTINCRDNDGKLTYLGWTGKEFVIE